MHAQGTLISCLSCRGSSGGGGSQERVTLKHLVKSPADLPSPDAKPEYHNAICTVANIDPQQSMYYQACPDNNRKVRSSLLQTKLAVIGNLHCIALLCWVHIGTVRLLGWSQAS